MKLKSVQIEYYRGIRSLDLPLDPQLTVLHGPNGSVARPRSSPRSRWHFAPQEIGKGRRAELDRHIGHRPYPNVTLVGTDGSALSRVDSLPMAEGPHRVGWGHTDDGGSFIVGVPRSSANLPPFVFYNVERDVASSLQERDVGSSVDYDQLFEWFYARENEELRLQRDQGDQLVTCPDLTAVRSAISSMIEGVSNPHIEMTPPRFMVSLPGFGAGGLSMEQLSDGYRNVLAMAADIAWRMERQRDPEVVVLIDEIELHLHPAWQQRILTDLTRTFPSAQFIVSTHSPQVLSTIRPHNVVELAREGDNIVAGGAASATYGAEAGDILTGVMGVEERPDNEFTRELGRYRRLIADDLGDATEAQQIRKRLGELSPGDPALAVADLEVRQRKRFRVGRKST